MKYFQILIQHNIITLIVKKMEGFVYLIEFIVTGKLKQE